MTNNAHGRADPPLYVDLDGTLVATDTLVESLRLLVRRRPWMALILPWFVLGGRAFFKERVARVAVLDPATLPYRSDVLAFLEAERRRGRKIVLATAAHRLIADLVARHLAIFDDVIATDRSQNIKGRAKLGAIRRHAGGEFGYMGDSMADLPILQEASCGFLVHPSERLSRAARATCRIERTFE